MWTKRNRAQRSKCSIQIGRDDWNTTAELLIILLIIHKEWSLLLIVLFLINKKFILQEEQNRRDFPISNMKNRVPGVSIKCWGSKSKTFPNNCAKSLVFYWEILIFFFRVCISKTLYKLPITLNTTLELLYYYTNRQEHWKTNLKYRELMKHQKFHTWTHIYTDH